MKLSYDQAQDLADEIRDFLDRCPTLDWALKQEFATRADLADRDLGNPNSSNEKIRVAQGVREANRSAIIIIEDLLRQARRQIEIIKEAKKDAQREAEGRRGD